MPYVYPPRVHAFREGLLKVLPRVPNDRSSLAALRAIPTRQLILAFVTWRMRLIPAKPRVVRVWSGGVTPAQFRAARPLLNPLLEKVAAGKDLTPHLSDLVKTRGIVLRGVRQSQKGKAFDMVLTREGLHHFHVGPFTSGNPKGRSDTLVFAEVLPSEFRIVALSDHRAFEPGTPERLRFFEICQSYMAKDVPPGQAFMANPVMASGHSLLVTMFADKCEHEILRLDPQLDDPAFVATLYAARPVRHGKPIARPAKPQLAWHFEDLQFGILDKRTKVFFCIFPFFAR